MMSAKLVVALLLSQYVRSHVDKNDPTSQCVWWHDGTLISFQQSAAGNPETPGETEFAAVTAAFATWGRQLDACSSLHFDEGARSSSRTVRDDTPLVLFRQVDCDNVVPACANPGDCGNERDCWEHANGALAITTTFYDAISGQLTDADLRLTQLQRGLRGQRRAEHGHARGRSPARPGAQPRDELDDERPGGAG